MKQITIFTPTYNRSHTLPRLYQSLVQQTCQDFVWLIVDDGSTDDTKNSIMQWMNENKIEIKYHWQENQGKSAAHNEGVRLTKTELFTCVDSDDYLDPNGVAEIVQKWKTVKEKNYVGMLAWKGYPNKRAVTTLKHKKVSSFTLRDGYAKYGLQGDTMLIYRTDILSKHQYPRFENETFVPDAYLYDLIDQDGELVLLHKVLYYCEYLNDGYTRNMTQLLTKNPKGYLAFIRQRLTFDKTVKEKALDSIRCTAFCTFQKKKDVIKNAEYPFLTIITFIFGYLLYWIKYRKYE